MERKTYSILFLIKKNKLNKRGEAPIFMRITVDGSRSETSIKRSIPELYWDSGRNKSKSGYKYYKQLNAYLDHVRNQVYQHQQDLEKKGKIITAKSIMNRYLGKDEENRTILTVYKEHNERMNKSIGKGFSYGTYQRHETSKDHLERFIQQEYGRPDMYLKDITPEFVDKYESYFRVDRQCCNNTTAKYMRNFGKIIRWAIKNEWMASNPFKNWSSTYDPVNKEFLTDVELEVIKNKGITIERIALVRDIFVFCCYTGLAYSDVKALKPENLVAISGRTNIKIRRKKTNQEAFIPLLPPAQFLIEKYRNHPASIIKEVLFPVLSNQKMNAYLKEVADICGIKKNFTTHTARHTFATTVTLANNISMESVSKMLGHADISMTKQYARILDKTVAQEMQHLEERLQSNVK